MNDWFTKLTVVLLFVSVVCMVILSGLLANSSLLQPVNQGLVFQCAGYIDPFYNCEQDGKFVNATGWYCNGRLVCENEWEGGLK